MKILYFADFSEKNKLKRENEIKTALEKLGHTVLPIDENDFDIKNLIEQANKGDLFFFHHGGVITDTPLNFQLTITRLETILKNIHCKKAFWLFDKVMGFGDTFVTNVAPLVDAGFLNDDTWIRRHKYANLYPMHLAWGENLPPTGKYKKEFDNDVVFIGSVYGLREQFVMSMKEEFGDRFKVYNNKYGEDFADMCESSKIIVSPKFPFDDFFWSDRVYRTLIVKGFLIHPRLEGLKEEFRQKYVFETYGCWDELVDKIHFWLRPENKTERDNISQRGRNFVFERFAFSNRLRDILEIVNQ